MTAVVVTGGTRGIGAGLVRALLARGARVAFCGRSAESVAAALATLRSEALVPAGAEVLGVRADVTDRADLSVLWSTAAEAFGGVDIWINNAGTNHARRPLWELPPAELDGVLAANLGGVARASAVVLAAMIEQGRGALWNMEGFGSNGQARPGLTGYGASKRAVTYLTDGLAKELTAAGVADRVTVHHLSPGIVVTDLLTHDYPPDELAKAKKIFNILGDRVETVTPWLADRVLAGGRNGSRAAWLTSRKAAARFAVASFRKRDLFGDSVGVPAGTRREHLS
ncbi:SDR family NAD(P)-dependent oxidoreductase [Micromonospora sp. HK10]|uniref:SDR family NAD(P)-dependent oxidoreductase n=1 Tax=Micromonospora sp. HK10 TaxID=1538294 RepID=UPI000627402D|nr:SDR family oxidoreductase [Micromonospora sp. HK10]